VEELRGENPSPWLIDMGFEMRICIAIHKSPIKTGGKTPAGQSHPS
jgi:hypothetical protein